MKRRPDVERGRFGAVAAFFRGARYGRESWPASGG